MFLDVFDRASMKTKHYISSLLILPPLYEYSAVNYMSKVNNKNTRARFEICSKLTIKTPKRCQWRRSGVFFVNFELISHFVLVFLLLTLRR